MPRRAVSITGAVLGLLALVALSVAAANSVSTKPAPAFITRNVPGTSDAKRRVTTTTDDHPGGRPVSTSLAGDDHGGPGSGGTAPPVEDRRGSNEGPGNGQSGDGDRSGPSSPSQPARSDDSKRGETNTTAPGTIASSGTAPPASTDDHGHRSGNGNGTSSTTSAGLGGGGGHGGDG